MNELITDEEIGAITFAREIFEDFFVAVLG